MPVPGFVEDKNQRTQADLQEKQSFQDLLLSTGGNTWGTNCVYTSRLICDADSH